MMSVAMSRRLHSMLLVQGDLPLRQQIIDAYTRDPDTQDILTKFRDGTQIANFALDGSGLILDTSQGHPRIYVPADPTLRTKILREVHDTPTSGHLGATKTLELLSRDFYWPKMRTTVADYVSTCDACQRSKPVNQKPQGLLQPLPIPEGKWTTVTMDLITGLPKTKRGHDSLFVIVDKFSKMAHYVPTVKTVTAPDLAKLFMDNIFRLHGPPKTIISDRDPKFTSRFWQALFKMCGTKLTMSTAYHPQTDGQTERQNRTIEESLRRGRIGSVPLSTASTMIGTTTCPHSSSHTTTLSTPPLATPRSTLPTDNTRLPYWHLPSLSPVPAQAQNTS